MKTNSRDEKLKEVVEELKKAKTELIKLLPLRVRGRFNRNSFIGGGAIYSLYNGETPKDYDFFLTDQETVKLIRSVFDRNSTLKYKNGIKVGKYNGLRLVVTDNAVSIGEKFQIITQWVGTPKKVIENFDFKHNMFYWDKKDKIETLTKWEYLDNKELRFNDIRPRDICGCIIRTRKFVERGFKLTNKEMAKILLKLHEVGFNERELDILHSNSESRNNFES